MICLAYHMFPGLDLYHTDPTQHVTTAYLQDLDELYELYDLYDIYDLDDLHALYDLDRDVYVYIVFLQLVPLTLYARFSTRAQRGTKLMQASTVMDGNSAERVEGTAFARGWGVGFASVPFIVPHLGYAWRQRHPAKVFARRGDAGVTVLLIA